MFQFIHTADLHLDSPLKGLSARPDAPSELLRGATRRALGNLVELAILEKVDFVVISGDIYDRDWKDYGTGLFFHSRMVVLQQAGIPVYMISGNHDAASVISRRLTLPGNVHLFSSRAAATMEVNDLPVAIHGMSFPNRAVEENLVPKYPAALPGRFNLGMLHTSLAGSADHDTYAPCTEQDLVSKGYDYWALGHVHLPGVLREDPWIVFPGNIQGRHAGECGERGCRLVSVGDDLRVKSAEWRPLDVVRWSQVSVDAQGCETFEEVFRRVRLALGREVETAHGRLLAARVILHGTTPLHAQLRSRDEYLEAEILASSQEFGEGLVWLERVVLNTRAQVTLEELASRDSLTKLVVDSARDSRQTAAFSLPREVEDMLVILPQELREELLEEWNGTGRQAVLEDSCSIVLERLASRGEVA